MLVLYNVHRYNGVMALEQERIGSFGEALRHYRELRGFKQNQLAEIAEIKQGTYSDWERAAKPPNKPLAIARIAAALGVTYDDLVTGRIRTPEPRAIPLSQIEMIEAVAHKEGLDPNKLVRWIRVLKVMPDAVSDYTIQMADLNAPQPERKYKVQETQEDYKTEADEG